MQVFKGALKEAIKEYQKKYGVFRFPIFLESIIFWLFLQFICHWMRIQVLPSPKSVNEVVFCEFARSPEFLSIFPLTKRIKKNTICVDGVFKWLRSHPLHTRSFQTSPFNINSNICKLKWYWMDLLNVFC